MLHDIAEAAGLLLAIVARDHDDAILPAALLNRSVPFAAAVLLPVKAPHEARLVIYLELRFTAVLGNNARLLSDKPLIRASTKLHGAKVLPRTNSVYNGKRGYFDGIISIPFDDTVAVGPSIYMGSYAVEL